LFPLALVLLMGALLGANLPGGPMGVVMLIVAGVGVSLCAAGWSLGIALRLRTLQSAPLMQMGVILTIFLSTAQMPLDLLTGWLKTIATYNPMTYILQLSRQGFLETGISWADTWPGLLAIGGLLVVLVTFAGRGMQRVIP
jgi:ABC-2 type transport system permease protein